MAEKKESMVMKDRMHPVDCPRCAMSRRARTIEMTGMIAALPLVVALSTWLGGH